MKKQLLSLLIPAFAIAAIFSSCKKDDDNGGPSTYTCANCVKTPEAKAANDNSSKGIYKGVVIGSSGTIKFDLSNDGSTMTATLVIDGKTATLTSSVAWTGGQSYVAPFTGTLNGQPVTVTFSVDFDGSDPIIVASSIPGHPNTVFSIAKETSTSLVEAFEGTYSTTKPETGTFNILVSRQLGKWGGVARENGTTDRDEIEGTLDAAGKIKDERGREMGTLSGDNITGQFQDSGNQTVTISGKRTL